MSTQGICGVNFSTLKKIANMLFNDKVEYGKLINANTYVIYIDKEVYNKKKATADIFEDRFSITIKPLD